MRPAIPVYATQYWLYTKAGIGALGMTGSARRDTVVRENFGPQHIELARQGSSHVRRSTKLGVKVDIQRISLWPGMPQPLSALSAPNGQVSWCLIW